MIKLKDILTPNKKLNEYGAKTSELEGTSKGPFGQIYQMKEEMKEGKFDPKIQLFKFLDLEHGILKL